ncbi:type IV pilus assembly protein PilW [Variovorax sp. HW608]|uniref:PilW family protein n=1 Tax=Variovorax sp. HW608 TaxID=1034889 RepID=UPI00081FF5D3|nr:PilW family protein [Variovorax sp. HW608]SCK62026.1 type IV pilus assembly protein PilW [Variovorax sp. HW608]
MRHSRTRASSPSALRGFTLVELMVGLVLGLLTVLLITQVMALAEGKKRTVASGSDAQVNGALSLFTIQRDIEMAGYGATSSPDALGCTVKYQYDTTGSAATLTLAPVVIDDGASGAPDTITILQGRTTSFSVPLLLTGVHLKTDDHFTVSSSLGATAGNMMIAVPKTQDANNWCTLFNVTTDTSSSTTTLSSTNIPHVYGTSGKWNQSSLFPASGYINGSYLVNMGSMVYRKYSIDSSSNLQVSELSSTSGLMSTGQELYPQIVNLQALYGKDTDGDGVVDTYDNTTPTTNAGWLQVLAIRVAVVARSNQYEKDVVTSAVPQWDVGTTATINAATTCGASKCISLDVSQVADWKHYRYKVYDTIVPLRNVLWNN